VDKNNMSRNMSTVSIPQETLGEMYCGVNMCTVFIWTKSTCHPCTRLTCFNGWGRYPNGNGGQGDTAQPVLIVYEQGGGVVGGRDTPY